MTPRESIPRNAEGICLPQSFSSSIDLKAVSLERAVEDPGLSSRS